MGFGNGDNLLHVASTYPEYNFIGIEVYAPGVGNLLRRIRERALTNICICHDDARGLLPKLQSNSLLNTQIFFPDPWHKRRHRLRRLVQTEFIDAVTRCLKVGGVLHIVTDHADYASEVRTVLEANSLLHVASPQALILPRVMTAFERRGLRLGHAIEEFIYRRV